MMQQYKPGDWIGGEYTVLKIFGGENQSGMGVVYLVQNREIPKPVVLKTFQKALSTDAKRQFISEEHAWVKAETLKLSDGTPYAEAHHIIPLGKPHNGPDVRGNILCVCPNDHVLLDYGAIKLDVDRLDGIGKDFTTYHNSNIYGKVLV